MTPETLRRRLADRGGDFGRHPREKSGGMRPVSVRRAGRKAETPAASSTNTEFDPERRNLDNRALAAQF